MDVQNVLTQISESRPAVWVAETTTSILGESNIAAINRSAAQAFESLAEYSTEGFKLAEKNIVPIAIAAGLILLLSLTCCNCFYTRVNRDNGDAVGSDLDDAQNDDASEGEESSPTGSASASCGGSAGSCPVSGGGTEASSSAAKPQVQEEAQATEARRKAKEEAKAAEARRKAEEEAKAAEARRKAEEEAKAAEARRKAEEEAKAAEARRKADEEAQAARERARAAEEKAKAAEAEAAAAAKEAKPPMDAELAAKVLARRKKTEAAESRPGTGEQERIENPTSEQLAVFQKNLSGLKHIRELTNPPAVEGSISLDEIAVIVARNVVEVKGKKGEYQIFAYSQDQYLLKKI